MKFASLVVVVSVAVRVARRLASPVKTVVVVVRHFRWHLSTRIFLPGRMR